MTRGAFSIVALVAGIAAFLLGNAVMTASQPSDCSLSNVEVNPESVIEPCSKTIASKWASDTDRGYALYIRGKAYHNTKRFDLAGTDYDAAILLTPKNDEIYASRANIAFRRYRGQEGVSFLEKALEINPSNSNALRTVGAVHEQSGDLKEANRYYAAALDIRPDDAYSLLFRSKNYAAQRLWDEALKDADALVAMAPAAINRQGYLDSIGDRLDFHILALQNRAGIYEALGQQERAEQDLTTAIAYDRTVASLSARGRFLASRPGREKEALSDLDEAISLETFDSGIFYAKGRALMGLHQFKDSLVAFDKALKINPQFSYALRMRARAHRELDETELAVADMTRAVTIDKAILRQTVPALTEAGYWRSKDTPMELTPGLEDAIRACMLDKQCN